MHSFIFPNQEDKIEAGVADPPNARRVYVATRFDDWPKAKEANRLVGLAGHIGTSRWIAVAEEVHGKTHEGGRERRAQESVNDLEDMCRSDTIIALTPGNGGCGMWFELGFMYALMVTRRPDLTDMRVIMVGDNSRQRLIFAEHESNGTFPAIEVYSTIQEAINALG